MLALQTHHDHFGRNAAGYSVIGASFWLTKLASLTVVASRRTTHGSAVHVAAEIKPAHQSALPNVLLLQTLVVRSTHVKLADQPAPPRLSHTLIAGTVTGIFVAVQYLHRIAAQQTSVRRLRL